MSSVSIHIIVEDGNVQMLPIAPDEIPPEELALALIQEYQNENKLIGNNSLEAFTYWLNKRNESTSK